MSVPDSTIFIMSNVPLDNRYEHTLWFKTEDKQRAYFFNKIVKDYSKTTYLRKTWDMKVEATMEEARTWSYLTFRNDTGKWYYYFITNVEYVNPNTVHLFLELDVIQSYMFDWSLCQCFVERTHTTTDEIGEHTIDEGLETGPLVNGKSEDLEDLKDMAIMVLSTVDENKACAFSQMYDNVFSGLMVRAVPTSQYKALGTHLDSLATDGTIDAITAMWMYPKKILRTSTGSFQDAVTFNTVVGTSWALEKVDALETVKEHLFEGYTPVNNKLYCYPFNFLYADNNTGGSAVYRYERFGSQDEYSFAVYGSISPDATLKMVPIDYNGLDFAHEDGLSMGGYPSCAWDSDVYKVWLAQNQNSQSHFITQQKVNAGFGLASAIANCASLNLGGAVGAIQSEVNSGMAIQGLMAQRRDMDIQPPQAKGNFSSNLNVACEKQTFTFYRRCITREFAERIDQYFTRYGYKVNQVMIPNLHARERFTYIKTIGCFVTGNFCTEDRIKIESIFDNGITFWDPDKTVVGMYLGENPTL